MRTWPTAVVTVAYLAAIIALVAIGTNAKNMEAFKDTMTVIAALVGVAAGAIPSLWFKAQAEDSSEKASNAEARLETALAHLDPAKAAQLNL